MTQEPLASEETLRIALTGWAKARSEALAKADAANLILRELAQEARNRGWSLHRIALLTGVTDATILYWTTKPKPPPTVKINPKQERAKIRRAVTKRNR